MSLVDTVISRITFVSFISYLIIFIISEIYTFRILVKTAQLKLVEILLTLRS